MVDTNAHTANDVVGAEMRFTGCKGGTLQSITISDEGNQDVDYIILFFSSNPAGTYTENAAIAPADQDLDLIIYWTTITSGSNSLTQFTDNKISGLFNLDVPLQGTGSDIYAVLFTTGTPTYTATDDIAVTIQVETSHKRVGLSS